MHSYGLVVYLKQLKQLFKNEKWINVIFLKIITAFKINKINKYTSGICKSLKFMLRHNTIK